MDWRATSCTLGHDFGAVAGVDREAGPKVGPKTASSKWSDMVPAPISMAENTWGPLDGNWGL